MSLFESDSSRTTDQAGGRLSEAVWADMLGYLRSRHPDLTHAGLAGLKPPVLDRGELVIEVADAGLRQHLDGYCRTALVEAAQSVTGHLVALRLVAGLSGTTAGPLRLTTRTGVPNLNSDYIFENFVTGPENRLAHATCRAVAEAPGRQYNPLFVHGSPGLGKTHLLQAICHHVLAERPGARIAYLTCESFVNEFIEAVQRGELAEFRNRYRQNDLLLVDDVQFLAQGERSQDEFFHTFNAVHEAQGQIVLSADCAPAEIPHLAERLVSRFVWGMVVKIDPFSVETRIAILRNKAEMRRIAAPDEVLGYLGSAIKGNARELEGGLLRLQAHARLDGQQMSMALARRVLGVELPPEPVELTIEQILNQVAERFKVKPSDIRGRRRHRTVAMARQTCMYLARKMTTYSLEEIGKSLGHRDHSTVLHAQRVMELRRTADEGLNATLGQIEQGLLHTEPQRTFSVAPGSA